MRVPFAWLDLVYYGKRSLVAIVGLAFSISAIFMQLGFYDAALRTATLVFDRLNFDILLVSKTYVCLLLTNGVPRARIQQARSIPGVLSAVPFYTGFKLWRSPNSRHRLRILVLSADPASGAFKIPELTPYLPALHQPDSVVMDSLSLPEYGPQDAGLVKEVGRRHLKILGTIPFGAGFDAYATLFTSDQNFSRIFDGYLLDRASIGLVSVKPKEDVNAVAQRLRQNLPDDVKVMTRSEIDQLETKFWTQVSPIGFLFFVGSVVAFIVGTIIVSQMLTTDVALHLPEYATLKAIGYPDGFLFRTVFAKIGLIALFAYVPAAVSALGIYEAAKQATNLPMGMTWTRVIVVFILTIIISVVAGLLSLRKVVAADPADLF